MGRQVLQEVFNKVYKHLISAEHPSVDANGYCAYRGQDGRRCAIGCLIADEFYNSALEGLSAEAESVTKILFKSGIRVDALPTGFLDGLQRIHDSRFDERHAELSMFADSYGLSIPE